MGAKKKINGLTGRIHPAVIEASGLDCENPETLSWIAERYGQPYHPLPVHFAERFDQWNRASEEERNRQIQLETIDPRGGRFTMLGAMMGDGILRCRERFAKACEAAVTVGDREFFHVFHEVYNGLGKDDFPVTYHAAVVNALQLLTFMDEHNRCQARAKAGEIPTAEEICEYLERQKERLNIKWPGSPIREVRRVLIERKQQGLKYAAGQRGGDRRSKRRDSA